MPVVVESERHAEAEPAIGGEVTIRNGVKSAETSATTEHRTEESVANGVQQRRLAAHVFAVNDCDA